MRPFAPKFIGLIITASSTEKLTDPYAQTQLTLDLLSFMYIILART